jgi:hypothetical protein
VQASGRSADLTSTELSWKYDEHIDRLSTMTTGVDSDLQPVARLPEDILHLIVSAYVTARSEEDALDWRWRRSINEEAAYPILPLLLSCKLLCGFTIPQLYRDIKLPRSHTLKKFITAPAIESYQYMHRLDVFSSKTITAWDLDLRLTHCFVRYLLKLPPGNNASNMDLLAFEELRSKWVRSCRPRLEVLKLRGQARRAVEGLLALSVILVSSDASNSFNLFAFPDQIRCSPCPVRGIRYSRRG